MNYDEKIQLLIIGDSTVGKTSLLYRYTENKFAIQHLPTVGIDFFTKDEIIDQKKVRIKIWDTAGQERYKSLTKSFFRNAEGIILVYDVSNKETFDNLKYWLQSIDLNIDNKDEVKKILIGNKIDIKEEILQKGPKISENKSSSGGSSSKEDQIITTEEGQIFAVNNKIEYFETSAKTNVNISECIKYLVKEILKIKQLKEDKVKLKDKSHQKYNKKKDCKC